MEKTTINDEIINMGGGCELLERKLAIDDKEILYCRLSDNYFTVSPVSADDMEFINDPKEVLAVNIGWATVLTDEMTCDEKEALIELINTDWYWEYTDMCRSWKQMKTDSISKIKQVPIADDTSDKQTVNEAQQVIDTLIYCSEHPGAYITITVTPDYDEAAGIRRQAVTAHLYDTACLVQSLDAALTEFIDEM